MVFEFIKLNIDITDDDFNLIYPQTISILAKKHWTSVAVAKVSSEYLVDKPGTRVLDIGSGAGKFCLVGASNTQGHFTGIEQRAELVDLSKRLADSYSIQNVKFIHSNITEIDFRRYDSFYFYNSFYENIDTANRIDDSVHLDKQLYQQYSTFLKAQFSELPIGTRLVTNCSPLTIIPNCFKLQYSMRGGLLRFWEKIEDSKDLVMMPN
jgi:SAM-dependent methyltransferase